jgi:uncharacterized metal-binding protein YceD (DUF177 family)
MVKEVQIYTAQIKSSPKSYSGVLDISGCERVQEFSLNATGEIQFALETRMDSGGKKRIQYKIAGFVMILQASGEAKRFDINHSAKLVLVDREEDLPPLEDEPEDEDTIVAPPIIDIGELIEDEVLLCLPGAAGYVGIADSFDEDESDLPHDVFEFRYESDSDSELQNAKVKPFADLAEQLAKKKQ